MIEANIARRKNPNKLKELIERRKADLNTVAVITGIENVKRNLSASPYATPKIPDEVLDRIAAFAVSTGGYTRRSRTRRAHQRTRRNH